ncbi:uracil phosphoribosyltransferase protein [Rutstroemia sp. NJR-2017a BBW]|nr:uracil phosphoribosyltransferase protein [Rutstroemia sp. NJR-2017a BBW]
MIASVVPGGLEAFQRLEEHDKVHWRQLAIDMIRSKSLESGRVAIVAGHFMFWPENEEAGQPVYTQNDLDTFTHILYLDIPVEIIFQRCLGDTAKDRPPTSITHLRSWQQAEKTQLRELCPDVAKQGLDATTRLPESHRGEQLVSGRKHIR